MNENVQRAYKLSVILKDKVEPHFKMTETTSGTQSIRSKIIGLPLSQVLLQIIIYYANQTTFYNHDWYDKINMHEDGRKGITERHDLFVKFMILISFLSVVETNFRELIRALSPGSCKN